MYYCIKQEADIWKFSKFETEESMFESRSEYHFLDSISKIRDSHMPSKKHTKTTEGWRNVMKEANLSYVSMADGLLNDLVN
jgi:hypothetical protein